MPWVILCSPVVARADDAEDQAVEGLKDFTKLGLSHTKMTFAGMKELMKALPKCDINAWER